MLGAYFCRVSATALHCAHAMKARPMHRLGALAGYCPCLLYTSHVIVYSLEGEARSHLISLSGMRCV